MENIPRKWKTLQKTENLRRDLVKIRSRVGALFSAAASFEKPMRKQSFLLYGEQSENHLSVETFVRCLIRARWSRSANDSMFTLPQNFHFPLKMKKVFVTLLSSSRALSPPPPPCWPWSSLSEWLITRLSLSFASLSSSGNSTNSTWKVFWKTSFAKKCKPRSRWSGRAQSSGCPAAWFGTWQGVGVAKTGVESFFYLDVSRSCGKMSRMLGAAWGSGSDSGRCG